MRFFGVLSLFAMAFSATAAEKVIWFAPSPVTADAQPFTCDIVQSGYGFAVSMYNAPSSCIPANLFPVLGSLSAGKVGLSASFVMKAPAGATFTLKSFSLKYATAKYPIYINAVTDQGVYLSSVLTVKSSGVYDVSAAGLNNLTEVTIQARTAARLDLTNISINDSL